MEKLIWNPVFGYENEYLINNSGIVKSVKGNIKNQRLQNSGYLITDLWKNNICKTVTIHRLVANTFIHNTENKLYVNHINGIKTDNRVENLEWCTCSENHNHALLLGLRKTSKIIQTDLDDNEIQRFNSLKEAAQKTGISCPSISRCINGIRKKTRGFKFYRQ